MSLFIYLFIYLFVYLFICLFIYLFVYCALGEKVLFPKTRKFFLQKYEIIAKMQKSSTYNKVKNVKEMSRLPSKGKVKYGRSKCKVQNC